MNTPYRPILVLIPPSEAVIIIALVTVDLTLMIPSINHSNCVFEGTVINPKSHQNEIMMLGVLVNSSFSLEKAPDKPFDSHFCMITKPQVQPEFGAHLFNILHHNSFSKFSESSKIKNNNNKQTIRVMVKSNKDE